MRNLQNHGQQQGTALRKEGREQTDMNLVYSFLRCRVLNTSYEL